MVTRKQQGFTIIEVVLVLAIAGLIFLMVFIALPALQRSQRDTQRKDDLSRFMSQITAYQSNTKGAVPASATALTSFVSGYMNAGGDTFTDPNGNAYHVTYQTDGTVPAMNADSAANVYYADYARCSDAGAPTRNTTTNSSRQIAVSMALEGGGAYCQQN